MAPDVSHLRKLFKVVVTLTLAPVFLSALPAHAAADSASAQLPQLLHRLQRHYQETKSFRAKFKEQISPAGGMKREREGTVYYRKPGRMRWDFGGEDSEVIVSDGTQLYTYQPDLNQVIETPLAQAFRSSSAASFLLGVGSVERDFDAAVPPNAPADNLKHVLLKPKAGGDMIEMGLDPATLDIRTLKLTDQLGDVTYLTFSDVKMGATLDDKLFVFTPPRGADIVKAPPPPAASPNSR